MSPKLEDRDPTGDTIAIYAFGEHGNLRYIVMFDSRRHQLTIACAP